MYVCSRTPLASVRKRKHLADQSRIHQYVFLFGVFYSVALALVKISIPLEWCRLFVVPGTWRTSYFWWGAMFVVVLQSSFLVVILVLLNVQCIPHEAIWVGRFLSSAFERGRGIYPLAQW